MSKLEHQHEIESKFRVDESFTWDGPRSLVPHRCSISQPQTFDMVAEYYDTEDLRLMCWGITLRRREGGGDEGWHLKLPTDDEHGRIELRMPLSETLPVEFGDAVASIVRGDTLESLVTIRTTRTATLISDASEPVLEFVDDLVTIEAADRPMLKPGITTFRELELELLDEAAAPMWRKAGEKLEKFGATRSTVKKIVTAIATDVALHPEFDHDLALSAKSSLRDVFLAYFNTHSRNLVLADIGVRLGFDDAVHQMRVSARRLRSALRLVEKYLETPWATSLEDELRWIASELGAARDVEVQHERLIAHAGALPDDLRDPVVKSLDDYLAYRAQSAHGAMLAAIRSDRYQYLIEDLISAVHDPHIIIRAQDSAKEVLSPDLRRIWKRLRKGFANIELDSPSEEWHDLRILAKRARYAINVFSPVTDLERLAEHMSLLTDVLGAHQDAHVSQVLLRELAEHETGFAGFGLGLLSAYERDNELFARIRAFDLWRDIRKSAGKTKVFGS